MSRSYLYYCGKLNLDGRFYSHFDIMNKDCESEHVIEGEIDTSLCNTDGLVKNVIVEDVPALPSKELQERECARESIFSASHERNCAELNEDLIGCIKSEPEFPEGISSEENTQREKTLHDVMIMTYAGSSSESVPECPLTRLEKVHCNVPVSEVDEEPRVCKGVSEVCDLDNPSKSSALETTYICKENVVQSCDPVREGTGTGGQKGVPGNSGSFEGNFVTRYFNIANIGECHRNPIAEFAVEVNSVTVIIKEFAAPCQEHQNPFCSMSTSENINVDIQEKASKCASHRTNKTKTSDEQVNEKEENQETSRGEPSRKGEEHLIKCSRCSSSLKRPEAMIPHFLKHHNTTKCFLKCPFPNCPSTISYKTAVTHLRGHIQEAVYTCRHCSFSSWHAGGFSRHVRAHKLDALHTTHD